MHVRCLPPGANPRCCFTPAGSLPTGDPCSTIARCIAPVTQILSELNVRIIEDSSAQLFANRHTIANKIAGKETNGYTL